MAKNKNLDKAKEPFLERLGSKLGFIISAITVLGAVAGVSAYLTNTIKETEIRKLTADHYTELKIVQDENSDLKDKIRTLKFLRLQDSIKIKNYGKK